MKFTRILDNLAEKSSALLNFFDAQNDELSILTTIVSRLIALDNEEEFDPDNSFWPDQVGTEHYNLTVGSRMLSIVVDSESKSIYTVPNANGPYIGNYLVLNGSKLAGLDSQRFFSDNPDVQGDLVSTDAIVQELVDTVQTNVISSLAISSSIERLPSAADFAAQVNAKIGGLTDKARAVYSVMSDALRTKSTDVVISTMVQTLTVASEMTVDKDGQITFSPGGIVTQDGYGWAIKGAITSISLIIGSLVAIVSPVIGAAISLVGTVGSTILSTIQQVDETLTAPQYNNDSFSGTFANPFCQVDVPASKLNQSLRDKIDKDGVVSVSMPQSVYFLWKKNSSTYAVEGFTRYTCDDFTLVDKDYYDTAHHNTISRGCGGFVFRNADNTGCKLYGGFIAKSEEERQTTIDHFSTFNGGLSGELGRRAGIDLTAAITMLAYASQYFQWDQSNPLDPYMVFNDGTDIAAALRSLAVYPMPSFADITSACAKLRSSFQKNELLYIMRNDSTQAIGTFELLLDAINITWIRHPELVMRLRYSRSDHACNPPLFSRTALIIGTLIGVAATAAVAAVGFITVKKISRKINTARAVSAAKVESSWTKLTQNPTSENAANYYAQVKKQNKVAKLIGGSGFSTTSYWDSTTESEPVKMDAELLLEARDRILKVLTGQE